MTGWLYEARYAARALRRAPAFTALAVIILGTGIGATTVMYTLVQAVLLREMPFADPERLVWMYNTRTERDRAPLSLPDVQDYRREASSLSGLALFTNWTTNLTGIGTPERLDGVRVSGDFFPLLGTNAILGRLLQPEDEQREARVTVLTYSLWQRAFGGDSHIIGREISLNGAGYTVVGVLPPRFLFPFREAELAVPIALSSDPRRADRGANFLRVVARLGPGIPIEHSRGQLNTIAHRLQQLYPTENARKTGISLHPLHTEIVRDYRNMLWMLFAAVGVLLIVGCVNLANLLLVRAVGRQTEFAVRMSLGASRSRLVRQSFAEMACLAVLGGTLGVLLADSGLAAWRAWGPADFPQMADVVIDRDVLLFTTVISAATALFCAVAPAWLASRGGGPHVRDATRGSTTTRVQRALQSGFVAAQIAAATVLLIGMSLMARGLARLENVTPGFTPGQALAMQLSLPPATYGNPRALTRFFEAVRERLGTIPGVESAGVVSLLPLSGLLSTADIALPDRPPPPPGEVPQAHLRVASAEYFDAAGIPVLEGRPFSDHDRQNAQPVAIVSRTLAGRHWPGDSAVGKVLQIVQGSASPQLEVVGVVDDVKQFTLDAPPTADLYVPLHQMPVFQAPLIAARMYWVVRARDDSATTSNAIRAAVARVDPGVAASSARTLDILWRAALGPRRANVHLLRVFGDVALVLCAIGVYGVAAFAARTRRREFAIRAALGASRRVLTMSMVRRELWPVLGGLGVGVVAALALAPALFAGAYATSPRDVATYLQVATIILTVAIVATYIPVHRAGAVNPSEALNT